MAKVLRTWLGQPFWFEETTIEGKVSYYLSVTTTPMAAKIRTVAGVSLVLDEVTLSGKTGYELVVEGSLGSGSAIVIDEWKVGGTKSLTNNNNGTYAIAPAIHRDSAKMFDGAGRVTKDYWSINAQGTLLTLTYPSGESPNDPILEGSVL